MRSNLPFILSRLALNLEESGTDIVLGWDVVAGGTFDPVLQTTAGGVPTRTTTTVKGFVHYVQIARPGVMHFSQFEEGDCIVDLAPDVVIDGLANLIFTIDSARWVVKPFDNANVPKSWDVVVQGQRLYRSVLLRKAT